MSSLRFILASLLILSLAGTATAHAGESFNQTEDMIKEGTPCSELSDDQLAAIGDYYMEQMHPDEMHDMMDERMGGEGSESLREAHIHMAEQYYCDTYTSHMDGQDWMPMSGTQGHMWGTAGWFGPIISAGLFILIILGIIYLVQQITAGREAEEDPDSDKQDGDQS